MRDNPYKLNARDKTHLELFRQSDAFKKVENAVRKQPSEFVGWSENYLTLFIMYCLAPSEVVCSDSMREEFKRKSKIVYAELENKKH